ncbi:MAG TPA: zinc-binding alcohol dehydrogenase family protein [Longimicrobium sp.]|nr:zinc-binding alcohol dehydrogenase family protein [Longimicrobium sp.]
MSHTQAALPPPAAAAEPVDGLAALPDSCRAVAVCGAAIPRLQPGNTSLRTVEMDGVRVLAGVVTTAAPRLDPADPAHAHSVLVRVTAFSCNYRDKALILKTAVAGREDGFYVVGSEFVGEVVRAGPAVTRVAVGDRVIGDNDWPEARPEGQPTGIPTNHASRELLLLGEAQVARVPRDMPDQVAAAFSIGAQTTYAVARRLQVEPGSRVLVTSAKSNTSLFAIQVLARRGCEVHATSTTRAFEGRLLEMGLRRLYVVDPALPQFLDHPELGPFAREIGGFDAVFDPYFDLHLPRVAGVLRFGGRYATCGLYDQYLPFTGGELPTAAPDYNGALQVALVRNLQLIGSCLGRSDDLHAALADYAREPYPVAVDSVYRGDQVGDFFDRTYNARGRFGKVVYRYA